MLTMRSRGGDHGANNKSWEMFQELEPYRDGPLPLFLHITIPLLYTNAKYKYKNTNTQTYKCKHTKANAPLKYISTNIQNKSTTYSMVKFKSTTSVTYIAIQFVYIHNFSKIECNTLPEQYDYNTIQCTAKSTTIQAELKLLQQELYGHWSYS